MRRRLMAMATVMSGALLAACAVPTAPTVVEVASNGPIPPSGRPLNVATAQEPAPEPAAAPTAVPADTTATSATTTATTVPGPRTIRLGFVGDVLPHSPLWRGAGRIAEANGRNDSFDFRPMMANLGPLLEGVDLAVCHLETPIAPEGEAYTTSPYYGVPAEVVDALAHAGFDRCSTASNHTMDRGTAGIDRTVAVLEAAGISQAGMARSPGEIWPTVIDVDGIAVTHLSYTWSYNGLRVPNDETWRSALIDPDRIVLDATTARLLGAEVVVVSLHWGAEQVHDVTGYQREIAEQITADGLVDLIVGHHAHVLQPIEQVNDTWVMFGLGNILSNLPATSTWTRASQDAAVAIVEITVEPHGDVDVARPAVHPTWVDKNAEWTVRVVLDELADPDLDDGLRAELERSLERSLAIVGDFVDVEP